MSDAEFEQHMRAIIAQIKDPSNEVDFNEFIRRMLYLREQSLNFTVSAML